MKKYNNQSPYYRDWTTKFLKETARAIDFSINEAGCFSVNDLFVLEGVSRELEKRGLQARRTLSFA